MKNNTDKVAGLEFTRKAESWDTVETVSLGQAVIRCFPKADILGVNPCDYFTAPAPSVCFIAENAHGLFLINTEGYDYARYALKIQEVR